MVDSGDKLFCTSVLVKSWAELSVKPLCVNPWFTTWSTNVARISFDTFGPHLLCSHPPPGLPRHIPFPLPPSSYIGSLVSSLISLFLFLLLQNCLLFLLKTGNLYLVSLYLSTKVSVFLMPVFAKLVNRCDILKDSALKWQRSEIMLDFCV